MLESLPPPGWPWRWTASRCASTSAAPPEYHLPVALRGRLTCPLWNGAIRLAGIDAPPHKQTDSAFVGLNDGGTRLGRREVLLLRSLWNARPAASPLQASTAIMRAGRQPQRVGIISPTLG